VCSAAIDSGLALPDLNTPRNVVAAGPRHAKLIRSTLTALQAVPAPPADRDRIARALTPNLRATGRMRASRQLSRELNRYGATVCGEVFAVGAGQIPGERSGPRPAVPRNA